ncbi:sugar ABC transporter substrate-binding protein [Alteribacter natronophilus]|uniref:sugar ABC transporter substrate-binding protein n=1 Tax=Alteribacter natronophilus TaxID=2583810 RepID=UPI00110EE20E|nr:extracellular solute-binding protein [Alteribacter natronophilus]TMW71507.1 extracellular solute-binding protein [Alteribacter natronophilus]
MFRAKFLTPAAILALSVGLAACGGGDDAEETPADDQDTGTEENGDTAEGDGEEPEKPESLSIWVNDEDSQLDAHEEFADRFEDEHGIAVEITPFSMLDQTEAISLDGPSGQGPDLFFQPHDRMGDIVLQGLARELDLTDDQAERLAEYNEEAVTSFSYEGEQYGIPAVVETYALFYNTDIVEEAPQTVDELMEIASEHTDRSADEYGFLMEATNLYFVYPFLTGAGGYIFDQDEDGVYNTEDIGLNNEGAVQGAELIQSWFEEDYMPTGVDGEVMNGLFQDGKVGSVITGPWAIPDYRDALGDSLAVAMLPEWNGDQLNSFSGNKGWLVSEYSEHHYWATELALFMTNAENSEHYFEVAGELPAHTAVEIDDEFMGPIFDQTQVAEPMPNVPEMSQVWEPASDALQFISQGDDPQEVLDEAVEQIREQIAIMGQ